jgi:hypothetical protein
VPLAQSVFLGWFENIALNQRCAGWIAAPQRIDEAVRSIAKSMKMKQETLSRPENRKDLRLITPKPFLNSSDADRNVGLGVKTRRTQTEQISSAVPRQADLSDRAQGKRIGRPALDPALQRKIAKRLGAGFSAYSVAKQLGIDAHTMAKYKR